MAGHCGKHKKPALQSTATLLHSWAAINLRLPSVTSPTSKDTTSPNAPVPVRKLLKFVPKHGKFIIASQFPCTVVLTGLQPRGPTSEGSRPREAKHVQVAISITIHETPRSLHHLPTCTLASCIKLFQLHQHVPQWAALQWPLL